MSPSSDRDATRVVEDLLGVASGERDDAWRRAFEAVVADAPMVAADPQLIRGPDGFGYFALRLPSEAAIEEPYTVRHVQGACTEGGFGCVILDRDGETLWVFRYGEMWALRSDGRLDPRPPGNEGDTRTVSAEEQVLVGAPDEAVLPQWARTVLRTALGHLGVDAPRVALVISPHGQPEHTLALGPLEGVDPDDRSVLTWYLPPHLGLILDDDGRWAEASTPL